jgi:hypothetical protein
MPQSAKHTDDALRKIGRSVVNFQKLEQALKDLIRLSSSTSSQSHPRPVFPRQTKRLQRAGLAEVVSQFNRAFYENGSPAECPTGGSEIRISSTFALELDSSGELQRKELASLARERNHLIHRELFAFDFSSEAACLDLCERLDSQNHRILRYLDFVRSIRDTHAETVRALMAFVESEEFLSILASDAADA